MKTFEVPEFYRSPIISKIKNFRKINDPRKKDKSPFFLDLGVVGFYLGRHFGFCYGVENAIEISFKAVRENPGKRIFLLSQMIHNPSVNKDLMESGVNFLQDTYGNQLIGFDELNREDIVIIPAFGTTVEIEKLLTSKGIQIEKYNTTCPFVERVWKKGEQIGNENYTIIIHGKYNHEETRATFSRSSQFGKSVVIKDMEEAKSLAKYIRKEKEYSDFSNEFNGKFSEGFNPETDLQKVGVINQTTMLATETQEIADYFKSEMANLYGEDNIKEHFADTRDTLCYATNENQDSTYGLLESDADLAIVVGGYNSSNTSHLVELLERKFPTYFISSHNEIQNESVIHHFDYPNQREQRTDNFLPKKDKVKIIISSGASCPDAELEKVILKLSALFPGAKNINETLDKLS